MSFLLGFEFFRVQSHQGKVFKNILNGVFGHQDA